MGREIGLQDLPSSPRVAVINQAMANFYFKGQNPIGRKFYVDDVKRRDQPIEVVGVVRDSKQNSLRKPDGRRFYEAFFQKTDRKLIINLEVRTAGDPTAVAADLRKQIQSIDASLPVDSLHSISDLVDSEIGDQIALAKLSGSFALLGLILACVGLYGIMSYTVSSRTREIGLRMALGAQHTDVLWLVLREALTLASLGIVVGVPSAMAGSTLISTFLFGVKPSDPFALVVVTSTLACVAVLASYIPARRAAKVDPMVALRNE
jgi:predicted permease